MAAQRKSSRVYIVTANIPELSISIDCTVVCIMPGGYHGSLHYQLSDSIDAFRAAVSREYAVDPTMIEITHREDA